MRAAASHAIAVFWATAAMLPLLAAPVPAAPRTITVIMQDYAFVPQTLVLQHGAAYRLHLENRGEELHEFHAAEFWKAAKVADPSALNAERDEVVVQPGQTKDVEFIAPPAGHYRLYCPDHDWAGMVGAIMVK